MINKIFLTCVILFITPALFSSEKVEIDAKVEFEFNDSHIVADQLFTNYEIEGELGIGLLLTKHWKIFLEVELDKYKVDVEEISAKFSWIKNATYSIRGGRFEGDIVLNDFLKKRYELFSLKTPGVKYIEDLGYDNFNTGIEYKAESFIWSEFDMSFSFFFNAAHSEPQFIFSGIYNIDESLHFFALTACYIPYIKHQLALSGGAEDQFNNILFDLKYYKYGESIVLAGEAAFGKNLIDPIGLLQFPGNDNSFFASADFAAGINLYSKDFIYTPAVRFGVLFPDVEYMYTNKIEILAGNYLRWRYIFLHIEAGVRLDTYKDKGNLVTALEPAWGLTFTVKS